MVSIAAFQAVDPGSIPGRRRFLFFLSLFLRVSFPLSLRLTHLKKHCEIHKAVLRAGSLSCGPYGAMVARLTPDQKVMCSNHIGVMAIVLLVMAG